MTLETSHTSIGVAKINTYWIASIKMPGLDLARPTAHIACSSTLNSGHWPSLIDREKMKKR